MWTEGAVSRKQSHITDSWELICGSHVGMCSQQPYIMAAQLCILRHVLKGLHHDTYIICIKLVNQNVDLSNKCIESTCKSNLVNYIYVILQL